MVDFSTSKPKLIASHYRPYEPALRQQILELCRPGSNEIHRLGELDIKLAHIFAESVTAILKQSKLTPDAITAIGSHGQTVRHSPDPRQRYTYKLATPIPLLAHTGITTVADFRRKDIALGGQGAPLVPAFHQHLFADAAHRAPSSILAASQTSPY